MNYSKENYQELLEELENIVVSKPDLADLERFLQQHEKLYGSNPRYINFPEPHSQYLQQWILSGRSLSTFSDVNQNNVFLVNAIVDEDKDAVNILLGQISPSEEQKYWLLRLSLDSAIDSAIQIGENPDLNFVKFLIGKIAINWNGEFANKLLNFVRSHSQNFVDFDLEDTYNSLLDRK